MAKVFVRSTFNYDMNAASDESGLRCDDVSLAKQEFAEECDINTIARRFGITGELPSGVRMPSYGDFSSVVDFHTAFNAVALANEAFETMPADVRSRFQNDPGKFVDFCSDESNRDEAIRLGLVPPPPVPRSSQEAVPASGGDLSTVRPEGAHSAPERGPNGG
jgi:phage internal scaffolding protein